MTLKIERATGIGFCFGVRRAIEFLVEAAATHGRVETLGAPVHNQPVLRRLAERGVVVVESLEEVRGDWVAIGAHGVSPEVEAKMKTNHLNVIDTTCPFVHRAQLAAARLAEASFFTVIYGEAEHPEVRGVLGWAKGKGLATLDEKSLSQLTELPRRLGVLSQTTQIPGEFNRFVKNLIDFALVKDAELRIIDTICHDIRERQESALRLAEKVDLMLVIGGHTSANSHHIAELCAKVTRTHLIESAAEIQPGWLKGKPNIGLTSGASTDETAIDEVEQKLKELS
ncbi:MAG: 4-hydroxy-3-methylbut-2-enyl diphosphate reductase [Chloroflexota bacterium]